MITIFAYFRRKNWPFNLTKEPEVTSEFAGTQARRHGTAKNFIFFRFLGKSCFGKSCVWEKLCLGKSRLGKIHLGKSCLGKGRLGKSCLGNWRRTVFVPGANTTTFEFTTTTPSSLPGYIVRFFIDVVDKVFVFKTH
jgi:hypothetical protein